MTIQIFTISVFKWCQYPWDISYTLYIFVPMTWMDHSFGHVRTANLAIHLWYLQRYYCGDYSKVGLKAGPGFGTIIPWQFSVKVEHFIWATRHLLHTPCLIILQDNCLIIPCFVILDPLASIWLVWQLFFIIMLVRSLPLSRLKDDKIASPQHLVQNASHIKVEYNGSWKAVIRVATCQSDLLLLG